MYTSNSTIQNVRSDIRQTFELKMWFIPFIVRPTVCVRVCLFFVFIYRCVCVCIDDISHLYTAFNGFFFFSYTSIELCHAIKNRRLFRLYGWINILNCGFLFYLYSVCVCFFCDIVTISLMLTKFELFLCKNQCFISCMTQKNTVHKVFKKEIKIYPKWF